MIAVSVNCSAKKSTWYKGGKVVQLVNTGTSEGTSYNTVVGDYHNITLGELNLLVLPDFTNDYAVRINFPAYFPDAEVAIWEYSNEVTSLGDVVESIQTDTIAIRTKLGA